MHHGTLKRTNLGNRESFRIHLLNLLLVNLLMMIEVRSLVLHLLLVKSLCQKSFLLLSSHLGLKMLLPLLTLLLMLLPLLQKKGMMLLMRIVFKENLLLLLWNEVSLRLYAYSGWCGMLGMIA